MIATMAGAAISIVDVSHGYGELPVLAGVSLEVPAGGRLAVIGQSGCGKSTLLSLVAGLEQPRAGRIAVGGEEPAGERLARCALMPQDDLLLPWRSALDNAALPLVNAGVSRRYAVRSTSVSPSRSRSSPGSSGFAAYDATRRSISPALSPG